MTAGVVAAGPRCIEKESDAARLGPCPSRCVRRHDVCARGAARGLSRYRSFSRRRGIDAGAARLRQSDRNGLLGRASAVLALPDVFHFLAHKFTRLRAGCLTLALVFPSALDRLPFRHGCLLASNDELVVSKQRAATAFLVPASLLALETDCAEDCFAAPRALHRHHVPAPGKNYIDASAASCRLRPSARRSRGHRSSGAFSRIVKVYGCVHPAWARRTSERHRRHDALVGAVAPGAGAAWRLCRATGTGPQ